MGKSLDEKMRKLSKKRRDKIKARAAQLIASFTDIENHKKESRRGSTA